MRLSELAEEMGMTAPDLFARLMGHPQWFEVTREGIQGFGLQSLKIPTHLVETFREYGLENAAKETIDHVKSKNGLYEKDIEEEDVYSSPDLEEDEDDDY